jgi:hypothetical protein
VSTPRFGEEDTTRRQLLTGLDHEGHPVTCIVTRYGYGRSAWVAVCPDATTEHMVLFALAVADDVAGAIRKAAA